MTKINGVFNLGVIMKNLVLALSLAATNVSMAAISNSALEKRHLEVIEKAIEKNCGYFRDLTELQTTATVIHVDQGIQDVKFSSILTGLQRMDQNIFDSYIINVESEYSDTYDHASKDWGIYSISNVTCTME